MKNNNHKIIFILSMAFMFLMSLVFLVMPYAAEQNLAGDALPQILSGAWFWATFAIGYGLFFLFNRKRKKEDGAARDTKRPGLLRFMGNRWAVVADCAFLAGVSAFVTVLLVAPQSYFVYALLSLVFFSFHMHCVLNGVNFRCLVNSD